MVKAIDRINMKKKNRDGKQRTRDRGEERKREKNERERDWEEAWENVQWKICRNDVRESKGRDWSEGCITETIKTQRENSPSELSLGETAQRGL